MFKKFLKEYLPLWQSVKYEESDDRSKTETTVSVADNGTIPEIKKTITNTAKDKNTPVVWEPDCFSLSITDFIASAVQQNATEATVTMGEMAKLANASVSITVTFKDQEALDKAKALIEQKERNLQ
jgi:hypothetical protein